MANRTISRVAAMVAVTFGLATAAHAAAYRPQDRGGEIGVYAKRIASAHGVHRIAGDCYSACSMWLGYRGVCVEPSARLWFHGAFEIGREDIAAPEGNAILASYYPPRVDRVVSRWLRTTHFSKTRTLTGTQLIALGMRACR